MAIKKVKLPDNTTVELNDARVDVSSPSNGQVLAYNSTSQKFENQSISTLPAVTASDNDKMLKVENGAWSVVRPVMIYSGTSAPSSSTGSNGDIYIQTQQ